MAQEIRVTYEEFVRSVWKAINTHKVEHTEFTPAMLDLLEKIKPRLYQKSLQAIDPRVPPYPLKEFLALIQSNWTMYDRPEKEFSK